MSNVVLGEQLAQFAYDHGGGLIAAIVLAEAMSWQGRGDDAESLLATFEPDGSDALATVRWGCTRAANLYWACGDVDAARTVLATVRDRVASPAMLGLVTAMEVSFDFFAGQLDQTISVGSTVCAEPDLVPLAMVWVASATAGALALRGRLTEVPVIAARGLVAAQRCESGLQRFAIGLAEVLALTAAGDFAAADQVCARYRDMTAGEPQANSIVDAMAGRVDLGRGALINACDELRSALSVMTEALPSGWVMLVAAWLAQAEAARGNNAAAVAALGQAEAATGRQVAVFWPELELARAWERAAVGKQRPPECMRSGPHSSHDTPTCGPSRCTHCTPLCDSVTVPRLRAFTSSPSCWAVRWPRLSPPTAAAWPTTTATASTMPLTGSRS
jgi:hypothetical protein